MNRPLSRRTAVALFAAVVFAASLLALTPPAAAGPADRGSTLRLDPQVLEANGIRTAYAILGPDTPDPLLLLNGTGSPMSQWDPALLSAVSRTRRVIVYDYPGLGASAPMTGRLTFDRLAAHAAALIEELGYRQADVLGWSMGGFVAQRLAVRFPERVHALILAGTNPGGPRTALGPTWVQEVDSDADATARSYVLTNYPPGRRDRGWAFVRRVNAAIDEGRFPPDRIPASTYDAMVAAENPWLTSSENLTQLRKISVPVLVITGAQDVVTPPANSRTIAAAIPDARLRLVPHAGHSFLFQKPRLIARTIDVFLS
ncbi:MAG: alpha/beta hydrolase [Actinobacteria bacterium]|nr:alpha/beta hydrolase [Actinomycetota bacterium]